MIIQRLFSEKKKSEKDEKKAKVAGGVAAGAGAAGVGSMVGSKKLEKESNKAFDSILKKTNRDIRGEKVAKKVGARYNREYEYVFKPVRDSAGNTHEFLDHKGNELLKRHKNITRNKALNLIGKSENLKKTGLALGAVSLGSAGYALKKKKDSKKEEKK